MKIPKTTAFIILGIILIIILAVILLPKDTDMPDAQKNNPDTVSVDYSKLNEVVFPVKISKAFRGDLIKYISANGNTIPFNVVDMTSNIPGIIVKTNIFNGKIVNEGDTLLQLDDREYQIALKEAEDKIVDAQINYGFLKKETPSDIENNSQDNELIDSLQSLIKHNERKFKEHKISENEYLNKKNELELKLIFSGAKRNEVILNKSGLAQALSQINRANLNLSYTRITAPFKGVIADFSLSPGQRINSGEKLFKIIDDKQFKVDVGVLENEVLNVAVGNKAIVTLSAVLNETFEGKVLYINPVVDPDTKTFQVTLLVNNINKKIKAGMFASVKIQENIYTNRILVPKEALLIRDQRDLLFVAEGRLAKWHYVDIGESNDKFVEILKGVQPGDSIITDGNYNLAHDSKIKIIK